MQIGYLVDHPEFVHVLAPAIWAHWREALPEDVTVEHRVAKLHAHMQKTALPIALVAHEHDEVFGTAALRLHDLDGHDELSPWLGGVFVLTAHRNRGIASALCEAIKGLARERGVASLYLFTPNQQGLYERLGWRTIYSAAWRGMRGSVMLANTDT